MEYLINLLKEPLTNGINLDDSASYAIIKETIRNKPFLCKLYTEWYKLIAAEIETAPPGPILEIGSGAGFFKEFVPELITSEVQFVPWVDVVLDGRAFPFDRQSLGAVTMVDVLHHIPNVESFIRECERCLKPGGIIAMIEPWITRWSKIVYTNFHHEPIDTTVEEWTLSAGGPMSMANSALPWMLFERDKEKFQNRFNRFEMMKIDLLMPLSYLLSGGISYRSILPGRLYAIWRSLERLLSYPLNRHTAMFATIVLTKKSHPYP